MKAKVEDKLCNLCGLSCLLPGRFTGLGGLVGAAIAGGYDSTPGNGDGALDDTTSYKFSLCEWCLDWIFTRMVIPPETFSYSGGGQAAPFRPAEQRVREDDWRTMKDRFYAEKLRRDRAREKRRLPELSSAEREAISRGFLRCIHGPQQNRTRPEGCLICACCGAGFSNKPVGVEENGNSSLVVVWLPRDVCAHCGGRLIKLKHLTVTESKIESIEEAHRIWDAIDRDITESLTFDEVLGQIYDAAFAAGKAAR